MDRVRERLGGMGTGRGTWAEGMLPASRPPQRTGGAAAQAAGLGGLSENAFRGVPKGPGMRGFERPDRRNMFGGASFNAYNGMVPNKDNLRRNF
jgi:hypothetical protein